ncbi:hypothetical protein [Flavobacterium psychrotrophum]|uniref:hypothetical protein n=1 Tax=Flavobacterium psychrotrophum TaxID=2294119 RepID=UPI000E314634|nr:hypothetical protein [Flavobacterium psychrotrophum]
MKYILPLFLFFTVLGHAQNYGSFTKVTAVRVSNYNGFNLCNISAIAKQGPFIGAKLQAVQSDDEQLAYALIALKKEARQWEKKAIHCDEGVYNSAIPIMYIVQVNRYRDTIFATAGNRSVVDPAEQAEYIDATGKLQGLLDENLCFFFERNYAGEFTTHQGDSIPATAVQLNGKSLYGQKRKGFEKNIEMFQTVRTDSVFADGLQVIKEYWINNYKLKFDAKGVHTINAYLMDYRFPKKIDLTVNGLQIGDTEEKLYALYPCSTEYKNWGANLNDLNNNYYYEVHFTDQKGYAIFYIRNSKINEIEIAFME